VPAVPAQGGAGMSHPKDAVPSAADYAMETDEVFRIAEAFDPLPFIRASAIFEAARAERFGC
jgi:hypothetical protein